MTKLQRKVHIKLPAQKKIHHAVVLDARKLLPMVSRRTVVKVVAETVKTQLNTIMVVGVRTVPGDIRMTGLRHLLLRTRLPERELLTTKAQAVGLAVRKDKRRITTIVVAVPVLLHHPVDGVLITASML